MSMSVTFNGTAPITVRTYGDNTVMLTVKAMNGDVIRTSMDNDEASALAEVLLRIAERGN